MLDETALITEFFTAQRVWRGDVVLPIGDDAAVVRVDSEQDLVMTADLLVDGVHFPETTDPFAIGYKSLAVNLSDLAAMGAEPAWTVMTLSLPVADPEWLAAFSAGFFDLAERHRVQLIGGDLARGPLTVGVHAVGKIPRGSALTRHGAQPSDDIYVSGTIGSAALGLLALEQGAPFAEDERKLMIARLEYPTPRIELGRGLRGIATAAIDLSDGLALDLGRLAAASRAQAVVETASLPVSRIYRKYFARQWRFALSGGDDYELCFTAPVAAREQIQALSAELQVRLTRIGSMQKGEGTQFIDENGEPCEIDSVPGYDHFAGL